MRTWTGSLPSADAAHHCGRALGAIVRAGDLIILDGPLGAGKTTLTQGIGHGLGVRGPITSPTFVIARVHPSLVNGPMLVHVDAYRLADHAELDDLDLDTDLDQAVTVVEWGAGLAENLGESRLEIVLRRTAADHAVTGPEDPGDEMRTIQVRSVGPAWPPERDLGALSSWGEVDHGP